jgi:hypothetical protein
MMPNAQVTVLTCVAWRSSMAQPEVFCRMVPLTTLVAASNAWMRAIRR